MVGGEHDARSAPAQERRDRRRVGRDREPQLAGVRHHGIVALDGDGLVGADREAGQSTSRASRSPRSRTLASSASIVRRAL